MHALPCIPLRMHSFLPSGSIKDVKTLISLIQHQENFKANDSLTSVQGNYSRMSLLLDQAISTEEV